MSKIDTDRAAARLARAMASDVAIYNTEKIKRGIENDRLFEELEDDIREAQRMWADKVSEEIVRGRNFWHKAFVDQLFGNAGAIESEIF